MLKYPLTVNENVRQGEAEKYVVEEILSQKKKPTLGPQLKSYALPVFDEYGFAQETHRCIFSFFPD